ncbi:MAG: aminotransferase class I/II-fold pyridoxal phosphate-dependent enzyme [Sarcina sp.]|nr:aminotransferase class I/II-fold pyridoxal phosphate-dependent enzyme [Sarcina sp.]
MKYDFTSILERRGRDALAVDSVGKIEGFAPEAPEDGFDVIPMWVADMNFPTVPTIAEAITERVSHPAFGYFSPREEYFESIIRWQADRHGAEGITRDCIGYENGVLGGLVSALNVLCSRGDSVLVHSPTYIGFTNTLRNNGYRIVHSPLARDEDGIWRMDYADMEEKLRGGRIHAAILCSPHNPCGRVWEREELERAYALFEKYDVYVISDEIWSDLILEGHTHIPSQSVSPDARRRTVALYAPSKTFNLAGLIGSYHIIFNKTLRDRILKESSLSHYNEMNVLSMYALIGAYRPEGALWLDELRQVLTGNVRYAVDFIRDRFEGVSLEEPEGTYMLFPDCSEWCRDHGRSLEELEHMCWRVGVALQDGRMFNGPWNLRINLALPLSRVQEAMDRLDRYVFNAR